MIFKTIKRWRRKDLFHSRGTPRRDLWVGWSPNGITEQKPRHFSGMAKVAWANRHNLGFAWRILDRGVCDGCALGVGGLYDWTVSGVHLCLTRLELLQVNTARAVDPARFSDVAALRRLDGRELRELGRLGQPLVRRRGERGFTVVPWDDALDLIADRIQAAGPDRIGVYLTARGLTNEVYYAAQKSVRAMGTNNIDNAARVCHAPSTLALRKSIGVGATTCSYSDVIESDLIILFGSDVANAQPVFMKYLYLAKKRGAKVVVVNPLREPGLERYWVPSNLESAMFGTTVANDFFPVHTGGDIAFVLGVIKVLLAEDGVDRAWIDAHTTDFDALVAQADAAEFSDLEVSSGSTRADMERFARLYAAAGSSVIVWSMGITQHPFGTDNVNALVDLALVRGNVGRTGAGLMPIRGHSGVQGGAEMGAYATVLPGGVPIDAEHAAALSEQWGFPVPSTPGRDAAAMVEAAHAGEVDVLWSSGGNFLDVLPAPELVRESLARVPMRIHQDIVLTTQMLIDPADVVVILPAATRYEQPGGGTSTTTERRIAFSPEIPGRRVGQARAEWQIFADVARRVNPGIADVLGLTDAPSIRNEIARVVPEYAGIETLAHTGDQVQVGGRHLAEGGSFPTPTGRARFAAVPVPDRTVPPDRLVLSTRRGKQFNSMVWSDVDPLTGADRDAVFLAVDDVTRLGLSEGERVVVRSEFGEVPGRVFVSRIRPGNTQMFFPEANPLLSPTRRDASGVPDYNAVVEVVRAGA